MTGFILPPMMIAWYNITTLHHPDTSAYIYRNRAVVKNNLISYSCMQLNDGGGIYTVGGSFAGRVIEGNIV